jgi:cyclopropane fatty-acyl-phospholipid synthase-like methyltransferase
MTLWNHYIPYYSKFKHQILIKINPIQPLLWILRRDEADIVNCYNFFSPFVCRVTGGSSMLNFGYWTKNTEDPVQAQKELCSLVAEFANLKSAKNVLDVGSGFSAPAVHWKSLYSYLNIICLNINLLQLRTATNIINNKDSNYNHIAKSEERTITGETVYLKNTVDNNISLVNAAAKVLPFKEKCMDRIIALESAQHFRPLLQFIQESKRILNYNGLLVMAIPVTTTNKPPLSTQQFKKLGILTFTWASEHYELKSVGLTLSNEGFEIIDIQHIGSHVYAPLTDYYVKNRLTIKSAILNWSRTSSSSRSYVYNILYDIFENLIYRSALKMKEISEKGIIDYVLIKAKLAL